MFLPALSLRATRVYHLLCCCCSNKKKKNNNNNKAKLRTALYVCTNAGKNSCRWLKMTENLKIRKSYLPAVGRAGCLFHCNKYQTILRFSVLQFVSFLLTDLLSRVRTEAIFSLVLQVLLRSFGELSTLYGCLCLSLWQH
jgi:hypothetical protein